MRISLALAIGLSSVTAASPAETRYYSLTLQGKKAGYVRVQDEPQGAGLKVTSDCLIKVTMLGAPFDLRYQAIALYAKAGAAVPERYTVSLDAGPRKITSDSRFAGGKAEVDYSVNGQKEHKSVKLPERSVLIEGNLPETWERAFRAIGPIDRESKVSVFSPTSGAVSTMTFKLAPGGAVTAEQSGVPLHFTLKDGSVEVMDVPSQNATFTRADKSALEGIEGVEAASRAFAVSNVALERSLALDSLSVDIKATVAGEKLTAASLQLPRQKFVGTVKDNTATGRLVIRRAKCDGKGAARLPLEPGLRKRFASYLKPADMIESNDPEIRALARKLARGSKTTWDAARSIGTWVHRNIAYKITGVGARQCLKEKSGDCGPHAWLSIALLRAAGVPARITGGALYSDLLGGSFGQHYWTDVWVSEKQGWFPIDTTSGEIGSLSPTHLNLWRSAGGLASLSVTVVDYAPKKPAASALAGAAPHPRRSMEVRPDETWEYVYREGGKAIGKESARVAGTRPGGELEIEYAIELATQGVTIKASGPIVLRPDGTPVALGMKVDQSGLKQSVDITVEGNLASAAIEAAGIKNQRKVDLPPGAYLALALSTVTWDLIFRTIDWQSGKAREIDVYLADSLRLEKLKLEVSREETIGVGADSVPCHVIKLGGKELFRVEKRTGRLVRAIAGGGALVVDRSPN